MNLSIAVFLLGVKERQYFGNNKWDDCGPAMALGVLPEMRQPLGAPIGNATHGGGSTAVTLRRSFASGTKVHVTYIGKETDNAKFCINWSDGASTGNDCQMELADSKSRMERNAKAKHSAPK